MTRARQYFNRHTKTAPLAVFRILFGSLMVISLIRFWVHGWIEDLYINPKFHFHYYGFEFVEVPGQWTYLLFVLCGISALGIALGYKYRVSAILFFLSFTYIELMDKTTYLNHYYFISVVAFTLIWLPSHVFYSVDAKRDPTLTAEFIPQWNIDILKLLLAIVYIYAGAAKLNADWLLNAMPLAIWLPSKFDIPLLGSLMHERWVHYFFSWAGAIYDLTIVGFLLYRRTRIFAFTLVVIFHILTRVLFPIGMFPYIMICSTLIFFSPGFHERLLNYLGILIKVPLSIFQNGKLHYTLSTSFGRIGRPVLIALVVIQVLFPWRYLLYPGNLFWTEQGYRFSWRVMLVEKTGYANFKIVNGETGRRFYVQNEDFLTAFQQKQMATQVDFIIEYAHYLGNHFTSQGHEHVEVYVESFASLNGRPTQAYIDPEIDLMKVKDSWVHKTYILPLNE